MTNPTIDYLRREEQQFLASRYRNWTGLALVFLVYSGLVFYGGVRYGRPGEQPQDVRQSLQHVTNELRIVRAHADSTQRVDSLAMARVLAQRPRVAAAQAPLHLSPNVRDSVILVERPATDTLPSGVDTLISLPVATFIREAKIQLAADSVALGVKDLLIRDLTRSDSLARVQDSLHVENEQRLEQEGRAASRRAFKTGAKVGALLTGAAVLAAKILIH